VKFRNDILLIAVLAAATNFAFLIASNGDFTFPDSATYLTPAQHLLHGLGYTNDVAQPDTMRTPVYPLLLIPFLAITSSLTPIVAVQHLINVALAIVIYFFVRRRFDSRFAALLAAVIFTIDTPTIHYANKVLTETLFTAVLFALFVLIAEKRAMIASGILAGLLVLIRPVAIVYFVILAVFFVRRRIAAFVVLAMLFPLVWAIRNRVAGGVFTVSSVGGINMLDYRAAGAIAIMDEGEFRESLADRQSELQGDADEEIARKLHIASGDDAPVAIRARELGRIGLRIALRHPIGLALVTVRGLLVNLFDSDWEAMMMVSTWDSSLVRLAINAWTHIVIILAAIGVFLMWRRDRDLALLIALTIGYYLLISAGGEAESRFRVPVVPQIAIAAAFGVDMIRRIGVTIGDDQLASRGPLPQ
jgi:Dolichyl-phosphate-mannose-protein mannosyltransferase